MRRFAVAFCFLACVSLSGCLPDTYSGMKEFREKINEAEVALDKKDFEEARKSYQSALEVAEKIGWLGGIVTAKQNLASIYIIEKNYVEAEKLLIAAKDVCLTDSNCVGLDNLYDSLVFFYLFQMKDVVKAENIADEVLLNRGHFKGRIDIREKLNDYAGQMRQAGYPREANLLFAKISSLN